jgi:hypothetical protein
MNPVRFGAALLEPSVGLRLKFSQRNKNSMPPSNVAKQNSVLLIVLGTVILLVGLFMLGGGGYLITLGGSWYFTLAGLGLTLSRAFFRALVHRGSIRKPI